MQNDKSNFFYNHVILTLIGEKHISIIKRKFYSGNNELLCVLSYIDFSKVLIEFPTPELLNLNNQSENFKIQFVEPIRKHLEGQNKSLEIEYIQYRDTDSLEAISIQNLTSIEDYNVITSEMLNLLNEIEETVITSKIERKFYSKTNALLSIICFLDFNRILISFINAQKLNIQVSSEELKTIITERIVDAIKPNSPKIKVSYDFFNGTDIIENIELMNVTSIKDYNLCCDEIMKLLSEFE
ncbi:MAG: hypothetical protein BAJALOKI1v1_300005 [Promethearchaeota archaeon]|nr:MAG: hypothetical protein BAJALOKI1v1_300005 [Candidatus Lokiarchaeota archaeon]